MDFIDGVKGGREIQLEPSDGNLTEWDSKRMMTVGWSAMLPGRYGRRIRIRSSFSL